MSRKVVVAVLVMVAALVVGVGVVGGAWYLEHRVDRQVTRVGSAFPPEDERPAAEPEELTVLLLGQDWHPETEEHGRSDAVMLVRVPAHRSSVTVVSIPRDAWVNIPGHGEGKVNSALVLGGPALAVATVEKLTRIRIDHVMMIDGDGFSKMTDALGGVTVHVAETVYDSARDITWTAGPHHLDGERALDYVGQRFGLPGGDLDRVRRHQNFLRTLMADLIEETAAEGLLAQYRVLDAVSGSLTLDDEWSLDELRDLAGSLQYVDPSDLAFTTAPVAGVDEVRGQSVVLLDPVRCDELWTALREDWAPHWIREQGVGLAGPVA